MADWNRLPLEIQFKTLHGVMLACRSWHQMVEDAIIRMNAVKEVMGSAPDSLSKRALERFFEKKMHTSNIPRKEVYKMLDLATWRDFSVSLDLLLSIKSVIKLLLSRRMDPNEASGGSVLGMAVYYNGPTDIVRILLEAGVSPYKLMDH